MSYEKHIEDCYDNRRDALEEEQSANEDAEGGKEVEVSRRSFVETFALKCRWGRVDALVGEGLVTVLCAHIVAGANLYQAQQSTDSSSVTATSASTSTAIPTSTNAATSSSSATFSSASTAIPTSAQKSKERERERDSAAVLLLQSASVALEVLHSICRLCDHTQIAEITIQIIKIWRPCLVLLDEDDMAAKGAFERGRGGLCCGWWRVVAELCRRRRDFAVCICEPGQDSITPKCLILLLKSNDDTHKLTGENESNYLESGSEVSRLGAALTSQKQPWDCVVWAMRVWRVCAAYGQGLTSVSELLLAAQLEGRTSKPTSKQVIAPVCVTSIPSTSTSISTSASSAFAYSAARALGPGIASRVWSLERLTGMMWLLEQAAVSCAAIIHTHTVKEMKREEVEDAQLLRNSSSSLSPVEGVRDLEEVEEVGRALETARLLLGVAEKLLPSLIEALEKEGQQRQGEQQQGGQRMYQGSLHRSLNINITPLVTASAHFLTSLLGNWQPDIPQGDGTQQGRCVALRTFEQHSTRHHLHPPVVTGADTATANTISTVSTSSGLRGTLGGVGLLQSCVMYAQYVRTSSARQHLHEEITKENTVIDRNVDGPKSDVLTAEEGSQGFVKEVKEGGKKKQYQFAALHHLESKVLSFVEKSFTTALVTVLTLHQCVLRAADGLKVLASHRLHSSKSTLDNNDNDSYSNYDEKDDKGSAGVMCAFNQWLCEERSLSILQLLSSALSYNRFMSSTLTLSGAFHCRVPPTGHMSHALDALHSLCLSSCVTVHLPVITDHWHSQDGAETHLI